MTATTTPVGLSVGAPLRAQRWVDIVLAAGGVALVAHHHAVVGAALVGGAALAAIFGSLGRRAEMERPYELVPEDVATAHRELIRAAARSGVDAGTEVIDAADDALLEVAALLAGRPARGGAQRRFVEARVSAMRELSAELEERHKAWEAARAELDAITPALPPVEPRPHVGGGVRTLAVLLLPAFLAWDAAVGLGRGSVAFVDGVVLRLRALSLLAARAAQASLAAARRARAAWREFRTSLGSALLEARARATAMRLRIRLQIRRARRIRLRS